ncbi:MAG: uL13 family ribosomal protein, partial [Rhodococcus sp.]|nr:uL13 family ribosomal protein [Rhodococcus sp. (in: high G+C Gram-positive bacteria)]
MSTYTPKAGDVTHTWHVIDATDVVLGRLAVQAANLLRGKHKPTYAPHIDGGRPPHRPAGRRPYRGGAA